MTGFGKAASSSAGLLTEVEIKSVNNRYLELSLKLPSCLQSREYELRELFRAGLKRGKAYVTISVAPKAKDGSVLAYNAARTAEVMSALKKLKKDYKLTGKITLDTLVQFKDLFTAGVDTLTDEQFAGVKAAVNAAIANLISMRQAEGAQLAADLLGRVASIETAVAKVEELWRGSVQDYFDKLKNRVKELVTDLTQFNDRMEMELALLADRSDITEECVRLKSHIAYFRETLRTGEEVGRKLNFLCQEMHREANTISSKTISTEITYQSVHIREEIERIREQVQNLE